MNQYFLIKKPQRWNAKAFYKSSYQTMETLIEVKLEVKVFGKDVKLSKLGSWLKRNKGLLINILSAVALCLFE
jgi:hypothetical protein